MQIIQAIRGMKDLLPSETPNWHWVESTLIQASKQSGYQEIRMPMLEKTELFKRSIGEVTDIVAKEMYTFEDRNGDSLSLRPEGTASCIRAALENGLLHNQTQRLWYLGPMFRHERPQRGRYRQFYQFGIEAFGWPGPDIDIEQILLTYRLWKTFGIEQHLRLEINSLGVPEERQQHRAALIQYLKTHQDSLNQDALARLETNPLRILDSKDPNMQSVIEGAPKLLDYLSEDSLKVFETVQSALKEANIPFKVNTRLVRGLDYYTHTVYEWITDELGAQGTVCGGGRYDKLVELIGGKPIPASGFAIGIERLLELVLLESAPKACQPDVYMIVVGEAAQTKGLLLAEAIRARAHHVKVMCNCGGGSFKTQFKRADKSGARFAVVLGESELAEGVVGVKHLREEKPQENVPMSALPNYFLTIINKE